MSTPPVDPSSAGLLAAWGELARQGREPMLAVDAAGHVLLANAVAERHWGGAAGLVGQRLDAALPLQGPLPARAGGWCALLAGGLDAEGPIPDLCVERPQAEARWFRPEAMALGQGVLGVRLTDVDDFRREIERSRQAVRELQALSDTLDIHAIVSVADRQGNILHVNPLFEAVSGYSAGELLGQNHRILNSGTQPPEFWASMWLTVCQGQPWRGEVCNRAKDGSLYWVDSLIVPELGSDGLVERYTSIRTDITRYKRAEKALAASRRMLARTGRLAGVGGWFRD